MPSILPGYEYDIFVSYRHKDNLPTQGFDRQVADGWVTEFVNALRTELEATFKDDISIYFDINPHDGLLETHSVDKSLEGKLKCLIFIPIISQTYCDPRSFAWQHEFCFFNKLAKEDPFGRDIKLSNGNVASRILPVKIHDLDAPDRTLLENELNGVLRAVEFIYRETGVNRPLRWMEENPMKNQNQTTYRNQVNKVANGIKEIFGGLKKPSGSKPAEKDSVLVMEGKSEALDSIAVLPFANMSGDAEQEYFSDGISEEIINTLAQLPNLKVVGRTSSFTFKGKNEDLRIIGEKLNVRTVLEGSVRSSGNRIRITAQLIDVQNGFHLWSEKYDRVMNDVFEVQDEIAKTIVEKLQVTLGDKLVEPRSREQTQNVEAYKHYLKGRALVYKRGKHLFEALVHFQKALEIDSQYALAFAGLADAYTIMCYYGLAEPNETWPKAIDAAGNAMKFGPDLAESHNCNAAISLLHDWNWDLSERQYLRAPEINPGYEQARVWYGIFYLQMAFEKHEEGVAQCRKALETNPVSFYANSILGLALGIAGNYKEGLEKAKEGVQIDPESYIAQVFLANLYGWSGEFETAVTMFELALKMSNRHSYALVFLASMYADWGHREKAVEIYRELVTRSRETYIQPGILAMAAANLELGSEALRYAEQAYLEHDPFLLFTGRTWPGKNPLRSVEGFDEILKRMGLLSENKN